MLKSQNTWRERCALQQRVDAQQLALIEMRGDEDGYETAVNERRAMLTELQAIDARYAEEQAEEDRQGQANVANQVDTRGWTQEQRELRDLGQRASLGDYVAAAASERELEGASKEYREHIFGDVMEPGSVPMEFLLNRDERLEARVDTVAATGTNVMQDTIGSRVFARSDSVYLGARMPTVPPGQHSYPMITAGAVATGPGEGVEKAAEAATITIVTADPQRLTASYEWGQESAFRVAGLEPALQTDIRGVLQTAFDKKVVVDLLAALTDPTAPTAEATLITYLSAFSGQVDGIHAYDWTQVRLLVGTETYQHALPLTIANIGIGFTMLPADRFRASSHVPAASADDQNAVAYRIGSGMPPRLMAPVWRGMSLIRDIYTGRREGKVGLTAAMFTNVKLTDQDTHKQTAFQLA